MTHPQLTRRFGVTLALCAVVATSAPLRADAPPPVITLGALEAQVPQAPALQADELEVEAALQDVSAEKARSGIEYTYQTDLGPNAIIVPRSFDYHVLRYDQNVGVQLPLFGSNLDEQATILDAEKQAQLERIALAEGQRERLATLREAYTYYWQYGSEHNTANSYLHFSDSQLPQARALVKVGFWTSSKLIDFLDGMDQVQSDAENYRNEQLSQLADISAAVGSEVQMFAPEVPAFFGSCVPDRTAALTSAFASDATLAEFDAETVVYKALLKHIRFASVEATASLQAGSTTDINYRVSGYDLRAAVNLTAPRHGHAEERDLRGEYTDKLQSLSLQETERRNDLTAAVDSSLDTVQNARTTLQQALENLAARSEDLRKATVRYETIHQAAGVGFSDVQERRTEVYSAQTALENARGALFVEANQLLLLAPGACGGTYEPMP
jgi:outer membrane protein TolC